MKKQLFSILLLSTVLLFSGCGENKENVAPKDATSISSGKVSQEISIGADIKPFTMKDQFDKDQTLTAGTKKLIFVFTKAKGHMVKEYLNQKPVDYLEKKNIIFVADVSKMPALILKYVALDDLKEHKYPILLIRDEEVSKKYINEKESDRVMIVDLDNLKVKNVKFLDSVSDFEKEIN